MANYTDITAFNPTLLAALATPSNVDFAGRLSQLDNNNVQRQKMLAELAYMPVQKRQEDLKNQAYLLQQGYQLNPRTGQPVMTPAKKAETDALTYRLQQLMGGGQPEAAAQQPTQTLTPTPVNQPEMNPWQKAALGLPAGNEQNQGSAPIDFNVEPLTEAPTQQQTMPAQSAALPYSQKDIGLAQILPKVFGDPTDLIAANRVAQEGALGQERIAQKQQEIGQKTPEYQGQIQRSKSEEERRGKFIDEQYDASGKVIQGLPEVEVLKANLDDLVASGDKTGPASGAATWINNFSNQLGLDVKLAPSAQYEQIEAASNRIVTPLAKQLGVNPTDFDFKNIKATVSGIGKSMAGNYALYDVQRQAIAREQQRQDLVTELESKGAKFADIKKSLNDFNKQQHIFPPRAIPSNPKDLKAGQRYVFDGGIGVFNGKDFDEAIY